MFSNLTCFKIWRKSVSGIRTKFLAVFNRRSRGKTDPSRNLTSSHTFSLTHGPFKKTPHKCLRDLIPRRLANYVQIASFYISMGLDYLIPLPLSINILAKRWKRTYFYQLANYTRGLFVFRRWNEISQPLLSIFGTFGHTGAKVCPPHSEGNYSESDSSQWR